MIATSPSHPGIKAVIDSFEQGSPAYVIALILANQVGPQERADPEFSQLETIASTFRNGAGARIAEHNGRMKRYTANQRARIPA